MKQLKILLSFFILLEATLFATTFNVSTVSQFRQSLEDASLNNSNDTIILQSGIYSVTSDGLGTFMFDDDEEYNLTIMGSDGYNANKIILDGNQTNQVINFTNNHSSTIYLKNISIVNGDSNSGAGGIYSTININLNECNISNNTGSYGGIYSKGDVIVTNCTISGNIAKGNGTGGISSGGSIEIANSTISGNSAKDSGTGGISSGGSIEIANSTISGNSARYYGTGGISSGGKAVVANSTIFNNKGGYHGSISSEGYIEIANSTIMNNAEGSYGSIFSYNDITITDSTISSNDDVGSIGSLKNISILRSIISNNKGGYRGNIYCSGNIVVLDSVVSGNKEGVLADDVVLINNTFIDNLGEIDTKGIFINNIFVNSSINFNGDSKLYHNYIDYGDISENDNIVIKKSNLQPTIVGNLIFTDNNITLLSGSPAIDAGLNPTDDLFQKAFNDTSLYEKVVSNLMTDYFKNKRVSNGIVDMGASEYNSTSANNEAIEILINVDGDQKLYHQLNFNFTLKTQNTIDKVYIDKGDGYKSVATTVRSFSKTYDTVGTHTIKVKVIDTLGNKAELAKSITIYDLNTQEAIEYGKKLCQDDPLSCGISEQDTYTNILNNSKFTGTTAGWRLLGSNADITPNEIFSKNHQISMIWIYRDGKWYAKGVDDEVNDIIKNSNIDLIDIIENGDGFWIKATGNDL